MMKLKSQKLRNDVERLANWILRTNKECGDTGQFAIPFDKRTFASRLGISPANLSCSLAAHSWYMHPLLDSPCINTMKIFVQEIPPGGRSGRLHHPGNQVIFILEGRGYMVLDGQKHHWAKNHIVQFPLRGKGVTVQHFNSDPDKPAQFIACEPNLFLSIGVDRGSGFEQFEVSPDYKG